MNPCKDCIVDMICIKECPMFEVDLQRLQKDEEVYLKRCMNNIKSESYQISRTIKVEISHKYIWWYKKNKRHRDNDQPAIIDYNGCKYWYKDGDQHRDNDQPAEINYNGAKEYYKNGKRHRDNDQPAVIWADGTEKWYKNGKLNRDNDQPAIIRKSWYKNGKRYEPM